MRDFSIDLQSEKIHSTKTREYFQEVIKSYYSESYRSAIVMLYSITIADLLFKLEELKEIYEDSNAIEILNQLEETKENGRNLSEWESTLVEDIKNKTNLFEPEDYLHITTLKQHRHLCAHPVLTSHYELYQPNKETTRAHIRNIMEGVLIKPALLSRKILETLLDDIASKKGVLKENDKLETFLNERYFSRFNQKVTEKIFRSLWRIAFKSIESKTEQNREVIFKALCLLIKNNYNEMVAAIDKEIDYYSEISISTVYFTIGLFNDFPNLFSKLNDTTQAVLNAEIKKDANLDAYAIFLSDNLENHIKKIIDNDNAWESPYEQKNIHSSTIFHVFNHLVKVGKRDLAYSLVIKMFGNSNQYHQGDVRFDEYIRPFLNSYTKDELIEIIATINRNSQIYERWKARETNIEVIKALKNRFGYDVNFDDYTNVEH